MKERAGIVKLTAAIIFACLNIGFHLFEFWTPFLMYVAAINGALLGWFAGHSLVGIFEGKQTIEKFLRAGLALGLLLGLAWVNNQISVEFYLNRDDLNPKPPFVDYFRFYVIGLGLGIVKAFYYAIVPSVLLLGVIGWLVVKIKAAWCPASKSPHQEP